VNPQMNKPISAIFSSTTRLALLILLIIFLTRCGGNDEIVQPIEYSHFVHFNELGMDCTDCHLGVEDKINATLPSLEICASCHEDMNGESDAEARVVEAVTNNEPIQWQRIYHLPDHVFFSHRRHVKSGKISCKVCHGEVENLHNPPRKQIVPIAMNRCMKCHDNKSISNDCITCHV